MCKYCGRINRSVSPFVRNKIDNKIAGIAEEAIKEVHCHTTIIIENSCRIPFTIFTNQIKNLQNGAVEELLMELNNRLSLSG